MTIEGNGSEEQQVVPEVSPAGSEAKPPAEQPGSEPKKHLVVPTAHVTPAELVEHLDAEAAAREAAEADQIQPFELVPSQFKEIAEGYHEDMKGIARDAGIPAAEMEVMMHFAMGGALEAVNQDVENTVLSPGQVPGVDLSNRSQCMSYLSRKYGSEAPIIIEKAVAAFKKLPESVRNYLDHDSGTGELLTNSPHVLLALAAREMGWTRLSKESAQKELATLDKRGTPLSDAETARVRELNEKGKKLAELKAQLTPAEQGELSRLKARGKLSAFDMDRRRILRHIISRGNSSDHKGLTKAMNDKKNPSKAPATARSGIESRIKELRTHPAYFNRDHKSHKEIVQQVSDLYAQLYGGAK